MISAFRFSLLVLTCVAGIHLVKSATNGCVPGTVTNLTLRGNGTLVWEPSADEQCDISYYLVYVTLLNGTVQFSYTVTETTVDVGHLNPCQAYTFRVHQVSSDNITGSGWSIYSITPPPSDANLALSYVNLTQDGSNVRLRWSLEPEYISCARHYRILIYNEDEDDPRDVYTSLTTVVVNNIVPCANYMFGVTAMFTLEEEGPITLVEHKAVDEVTTPPELDSLTLGANSVELKWNLEPFVENRCPITSIILDGSAEVNITQDILDQPNRSPISITLTDLSPDSLYYVRAVVLNSAGYSDPFLMAVQTLSSS